jgi:hypothetical protein
MQPSARLFWYAYGWPCGEQPEFGDEMLQDKSWGEFVPFSLEGLDLANRDTIDLTTEDGDVTAAGVQCRVDRQPADGRV